VIIPRQCLILILHQRFKLKHAHLADILGMDRATVYHAISRAKELLSIKDGHYVLSVQRWASIIDEFEEDMVKVDSMKRTETTEQIILEVLSKYDEAKALDILRSVTQKIQS